MCEGGKLITEAEFVGAISSRGKCKAVILLLHFLVQGSPIRVLQTTVHIIMATGDHLQNHKYGMHVSSYYDGTRSMKK